MIRFLLESFVSSSFFSSPEIFFLNFVFYLHFFDGVSLQDSQLFEGFVFFERSNFVLNTNGSSTPSVLCRLSLFIKSMVHFSMPNSIPMSWLNIQTVCIRVSSSFSFFAYSFLWFMYIRWLIFSFNLLSLYPAVYFPSMWFSGIMIIMNCKSDCASPWKIPL